MNAFNSPFMDLPSFKSPRPPILVVDDSTEVCQLLDRSLQQLGHKVVSFTSPGPAVVYLLDPDVELDLAIIDLRLGEHDGGELLAFIAERHPAARRVLMSGMVGTGVLTGYTRFGQAHAVLAKPWDRKDLSRLVEAVSSARQ